MLPSALPEDLQLLRRRHGEVFVIVSPPRSASTALARLFWEHPEVGYYCHEPFEVTYYEGAGLDEVAAKLAAPLELGELDGVDKAPSAAALVVKEMPYQVGERFPLLAELATAPLVFLMRDPRLAIASRMAKKREVGDDPFFPTVETGWELLERQIDWCRERGRELVVVDAADYRNRPRRILPALLERLELDFDPSLLDWRPCPEVELDNLGGRHRHLYGAVLASSGVARDDAPVPPLETFPVERGWRRHVERCLAIYRRLAAAPERLRPREAGRDGAVEPSALAGSTAKSAAKRA